MPSLKFKQMLVTQDRNRTPAQRISRGQSLFVFAECTGKNELGSHQSVPYTVSIEGFNFKDAVQFVTLAPGETTTEQLIYAGVPVIEPSVRAISIKLESGNQILSQKEVEVN